jgi:hypothetical protein
LEAVLKISEEGWMQGARSAETGMYKAVHEDFEHHATPQTPSAAFFKTTSYIVMNKIIPESSTWLAQTVAT